MSAPHIAAVLFDLDGTLVDSNEAHVAVWEQVFREAGHPIDAGEIRGQIGKGGDLLVPDMLPDLGEREQEALAARHGELFKDEWLDRIVPFPGAHDLLARVHARGARVVFASSAGKGELKHYLKLLGAEALVDAQTSIDDVGTSKPAPDIFAVALQKAGVAPGEAVAVGDSPFDIEAAGKAGVATVAVRSGGFSDDALARAVAIYDDVADLLALFEDSPLAG